MHATQRDRGIEQQFIAMSTTTKSQRHHYIPKFLLKNFIGHDGYLWVADRGQHKIYKTRPRKAFVEKGLYVRHDIAQSTKNYEYELRLSKMESDVAPVIQEIIQRARKGQPAHLSEQNRRILKEYFLAMARRTPESQMRVSQVGDKDAFYEAARAQAEKHGFQLADRESLYTDPRILEIKRKIESNVNAGFASGVNNREKIELERFCKETGFLLARIGNPRRSFVIGSHGVAIVDACRPRDQDAGTWLPIAHDVALLVTAYPEREFFLSLGDDAAHETLIKRINLASLSLSQIIAGRSEALISSLSRRKARNGSAVDRG